jgi:hypothetical protein
VHSKKHLNFNALRKVISECSHDLEDKRQKGKVNYSMHDCLLSAFAMMFFQDPSLLAFQRRMQEGQQYNNLAPIFNITAIPQDSQIREVLDRIDTNDFRPIFINFLQRLQRGKHLADFKVIDGKYLVSIDGSEYFSSPKIHCPGCLYTKDKKGNVRYHHQIVQAVIVHPDKRQVLPLAPEAITNRDGSKKQDCEINAAKRMLPHIRSAHQKLDLIITADGLYSRQPFIDALKDARMSFILVAKPGDHKVLFEWVAELTGLGDGGQLKTVDDKGRRHHYKWINQVPLNGTKDADLVNFFEYQLIRDGKITYRNSWVTDQVVDQNNVITLVKAGRARWKIENETFNTLKNQGYHLEHNYGHGQQHLSMNFFVLNLLAFYVHQILDLTDKRYQRCRASFSARREYWNQLRYSLRIMLFRSFDHLLDIVYDPPDIRAP